MMKRAALVYGLCTVLLMAMVLRLFWVGQGEIAAYASLQQSSYTLTVGQVRGTIYDCRFEPLVGREKQTVSAVVPSAETLSVLEEMEEEERLDLLQRMESGKPFLYHGRLDAAPGISLFQLPVRYDEQGTAVHVIGYLDGAGKQGVAGIEAAYDQTLRDYGGEYQVSCRVDAAGHALAGEITVYEQGKNGIGGVVLSLDRRIQQAAEQALRSSGTEAGAVVVMDIWSGELKAMASLPDYDQNDVAAALKAQNAPLLNRALCAYSVGSTFKLAVAAAALEQGVPEETEYDCPGYVSVDGHVFHCHNLAGHGRVNMSEAMEHSCNVYFIKLAQEIGGQALWQMARQLGFGSGVRLAPGIYGAGGTLATPEELSGGELANFAFGQGRLTATPLQLAVMVSAIANGGQRLTPRLVLGVTDDGTTLARPCSAYAVDRAMSSQTAQKLCEMMVRVVEEGSGSQAQPRTGGAGGKTASAQTGTSGVGGSEIVHAWFSGFYPVRSPRWAIVVLCEGGESGGDVAAPVFQQIADAIAALGYVADPVNIP